MDTEELTTTREESESAESESASARGRVRRRATGWFSVKAFLVALALAAAGVLAGGSIPVVGGFGGLVGVFVAGILLGLVGNGRRYVEVGTAGAAVAGASALLDHIGWALVGIGLPLVVVGAGAGLVAGVLGHYLGRDLRAGLAKDI